MEQSDCGSCGCNCGPRQQSNCTLPVNRRQWLRATVAAAGTAVVGSPLLGSAASAEGATKLTPARPKARILKLYGGEGMEDAWARPHDRPWLATTPADCEKQLADLAKRLGNVEFVGPHHALAPKEALELATALAKDVDAILVFGLGDWGDLVPVCNLGLPTVMFNITCDAFSAHWFEQKRQEGPNSKILALSSRDFSELERGVRLLRVPGLLKRSRLLFVGRPCGITPEDIKAELGTEVVELPVKDIGDVCQDVDPKLAEAEAQQYWLKQARKVDARPEDVVSAVRLQIALRKIMDATKAQAIAIDCLGALTAPKMETEGYPCLAFSALQDEGWVTSCQGDMDNAVSKMILRCAFDLPSFMGNIFFDTGKRTVILDHCTAPTKMGGADAPRLTFDVPTHHTNTGACPHVEMPIGETATVARLVGAEVKGLLFFAAKITANPEGMCRTTVELKPSGGEKTIEDFNGTGAHRGLHQTVCLGDHVRDLKDLCTLLGMKHHADLV